MFDTYVINLKKDIHNFYRIKKTLNKKGIQPKRFNAIYGKDIKNLEIYNKYLSPFCKIFCPRGLIGCALSHYILLEKIYLNYKQNKISNYSLILEDDVIPLFNCKNDIEKILEIWPDDCDILSLYCQGLCKYKVSKSNLIKGNKYMGSAAAYLVKNDSIPKINKYKIFFHIDIQRFRTKFIKIYLYNRKLFDVNNNSSYNTDLNINQNTKLNHFLTNKMGIENSTFYSCFLFKIFKIPLINYEMTLYDILKIIVFILIIIIIYKMN